MESEMEPMYVHKDCRELFRLPQYSLPLSFFHMRPFGSSEKTENLGFPVTGGGDT